MSGAHRKHRDNPNYKSKMQKEKLDLYREITHSKKDIIKRELSELLPEDTSSDIITRLATYVMVKLHEEH
jgi:hypothetical protein